MVHQVKTTEIGEGLYQLSSRLGPRYVHQYVIVEDGEAVLIDTGMKETPAQVILPFLKDIGITPDKLKAVVISHADVDHFSGLKGIRQYSPTAMIMAHSVDVPWIESAEKIQLERYFYYETFGVAHDEETKSWFIDNLQAEKVDIHLNGGESLCLGRNRIIDIIHTPGHSAGHVSVYDRKNKATIVIDAILWKGLYDTEGQIISPPPYYSIAPYVHSIETILQLDSRYLLTGHYDILTGADIQTFLHESKDFVGLVEDTVRSIVRESDAPLSLKEILLRTNERVGNFTAMMVELVGPVYAHLNALEKEGVIWRQIENKLPYWSS